MLSASCIFTVNGRACCFPYPEITPWISPTLTDLLVFKGIVIKTGDILFLLFDWDFTRCSRTRHFSNGGDHYGRRKPSTPGGNPRPCQESKEGVNQLYWTHRDRIGQRLVLWWETFKFDDPLEECRTAIQIMSYWGELFFLNQTLKTKLSSIKH